MADHNFKINLGINIKKGDSQKQLNDIRKKLEEKKIQLKVDTSKVTAELKTFKDSLNDIQKKLNDAFKLNKGQLQNLQDLKKVLSEINKLSKKTQIKISNGKDVTELVSNLENCKTKYTQLLKMKQSLEKQMAKTSNATAYKNLKEQLALVTKEAENCKTKISKLTELKLKTDMTKSMSSQFQAVQKQAQTLKNSLEKTLRNTNLASEQKKQLEQMLANVKTISQTRFRLKTSDAEAQLQKLLSDIEKIKKSYSNVKINIKATDNLNKATKSVNTFINKLKTAQNTKTGANAYINGTDLNKLIVEAENLKNKLKSIKMTDNVGTETAKILKGLDTIENKFKNLQNVAKLDMKLSGGASSLTKQIDTLTSKIQNMKNQKIGSDAFIDEGKLTQAINDLEKYKNQLKNLDVNDEKVVSEFENIKNSVEKVDTEIKQLKADSKFELKLAQSQNQIDAMANRIDKLQQKAQKLGMTVPEIQQFRDRLADIAKLPLGEQAVALGKLGNEITKTNNKMTALGSATKRTQTFFSNLYSSMSTFSLGNIISMQITKAIYGISDTIRELDKAFVNLNKVAPDSLHGTAEEFDALREKAISVGQDVARSSVDIINSTASALQLGIDNIDRAMEYAKNVNMYANVADISEEDSDKYIKSIMSAYGGVNQSLDEMKDKVKGAGDGYSMLTNYMDMAEICLAI